MAVAVIAAMAMTACSPSSHSAAPSRTSRVALPPASAGPVTAASCLARRIDGPLPTWARGGFNPPGTWIGHVMGVRGDIVAILWGGPMTSLYAPPRKDQSNKILWVSRPLPGISLSPLAIRATLDGTHLVANRELPNGPGPSYVNLPAPGCWTLDLSWAGHQDQVDLWYTAS